MQLPDGEIASGGLYGWAGTDVERRTHGLQTAYGWLAKEPIASYTSLKSTAPAVRKIDLLRARFAHASSAK